MRCKPSIRLLTPDAGLAVLFAGLLSFGGSRQLVMGDPGASTKVKQERRNAVIRNHSTWRDSDGKIIDCHEGGIQRVGDTFYWYGRTYRGNVDGVFGTGGAKFRCGFVCYSSKDLAHWTNEGDILKYEDAPKEYPWMSDGTWHRPRMIHDAQRKKHVLWFFVLGIPNGKAWVKDMVAEADSPKGPFKILAQPKVSGLAASGDVATLLDDDGKGYLMNGDWSRNALVLPLAPGFRDTVGQPVMVLEGAKGQGYEGVCVGKYRGKYVAAASGVVGLGPSESTFAVADQPLGPWRVKGIISEQKTWNSQIGSFFHLQESDTMIVLCDQWLRGPRGERVPAAECCQLWVPLKFDPKAEEAKMVLKEAWNPWYPEQPGGK